MIARTVPDVRKMKLRYSERELLAEALRDRPMSPDNAIAILTRLGRERAAR